MESLKTIRRRLRSVQSTQKIFKAMELVAAAKLRRAQARALAARPYAARIHEMLENLAGAASELESPLLKARETRTTALVVVTSDRGFCGAHNVNLLRVAEERLREAPPGSLKLYLMGRKGRDYFRRRKWPVLAAHANLPGEASLDLARTLTRELIGMYLEGVVDRVEILYTRFVSALRRRVTREVFLPVGAERPAGAAAPRDFIFEPDADAIFAELLPRYAAARMFAVMADALASEYAARMIAMGAARKNAGELQDMLILKRNRLRQTMITRELLDIVGGAEALR